MSTAPANGTAAFPWRFERPEQIRFAHCDPAGIAFFARLDELLNATFEDWCAECGVPFSDMLGERGYGFPLAHASVDYQRALRMGDRVRIVQTVEKVGQSSITFRLVIEPADGAGPALTATHVRVATEYASGTPRPLPATLRERLEASAREQVR